MQQTDGVCWRSLLDTACAMLFSADMDLAGGHQPARRDGQRTVSIYLLWMIPPVAVNGDRGAYDNFFRC